MTVEVEDQGYTVTVDQEDCDVTVVAPGAAGALGYYGSFFSDVDQAAAAVDTATAMTLNNTAEANGVSIASSSRITFAYPGTYDIQFSAQAHHRGGGGNGLELDIWFRKNGNDIADSATKLVIQKNDYLVPAWDFLLTVNAGDYVQIMYQVDNTDIVFEHVVADGVPVDTPSVIVTVMQVMYTQVGPQGATGATGPQGPTGATGSAATITAGTTTTLSPGASATVTNAGTSSAAIFNFGIPAGVKGDKGDTGDPGDDSTITVGTTTTLSPGASATVVNSGTASAAILDFGIPAGLVGATGGTGPTGATGPAGAAATIAAGTTTTLSPGASATVTNSGTSSAAVFDFGIPAGLTGATGGTGPQGPAGVVVYDDDQNILAHQVFSLGDVMASFGKIVLTGSTDGRGILVSGTTSGGANTVHTASATATIFDEVWLYAQNTDTTARKLTVEWGGAGAGDIMEITIPAESGLTLVSPGLVLKGNATPLVVKAFAATTNVVAVYGYVNRIS